MSSTADRLRWASEVIVALGGGLRPDGGASQSTLLRAEKAAELAIERPSSLVVLSGSRGGSTVPEWNAERPERSEALHMADVLRSKGVPDERIFEEDESRDTIGNAVLVRARYLNDITPRPLTIVTSPHHVDRALFIFAKVFPAPWEISVAAAAPAENATERAALEPKLMLDAEDFFADLPPGDFGAICHWLVRRHPYYAGVSAHS